MSSSSFPIISPTILSPFLFPSCCLPSPIPNSSFPTSPFPTSPFPTFPFPISPFPISPFPISPFPTSPFPTSPFPTSPLFLLLPLTTLPASVFHITLFQQYFSSTHFLFIYSHCYTCPFLPMLFPLPMLLPHILHIPTTFWFHPLPFPLPPLLSLSHPPLVCFTSHFSTHPPHFSYPPPWPSASCLPSTILVSQLFPFS